MRHAITVGTLAVALALAACDPNPSMRKAQDYYATHRTTVDTIDRDLRTRVASMPAFAEPLRCDAQTEACQQLRAERHAAQLEAQRQLRVEAVRYLDLRGVIGVEVQYFPDREHRPHTLLDIGLTPGGHAHGRVLPDRGFAVGDRRVGYGAYQTAFQSGNGPQQGDGTARHGLEVAWRFDVGGTTFDAVVYVLAKDETSPAWRAAMRARGP